MIPFERSGDLRRAHPQPLRPVPRLRADARPARRWLAGVQPRAHRQRQVRLWLSRPGNTTSTRRADRSPASTVRRSTLAPGTSASVTLQIQSLARRSCRAGVVSGDFHVHGGASFDSGIPDLDRVVSFLATGVDVIIATDHNVVTNYASTLAMLGATNCHRRHPRRRADAQHPLVLRPRRHVPQDAGPLQFLAAGPRLPADPQRRPLAGVARARPGDGRHGRSASSPTPRPACGSSITLPARQAGARSGIPARSATTRPADSRGPTGGSASRPTRLARAPGGHHRNIDWDVEEVMTGAPAPTGCATARSGSPCSPGVPARRHRQQRFAHAVDGAGRVPAKSRLGRPRPPGCSTSTDSTPTCSPATLRGLTVPSSTSPSTTERRRLTAPTWPPSRSSPTATLKDLVASAP